MATIENTGLTTSEQFRAEIGAMTDPQLMAQELMQQGALRVLSSLLRSGYTKTNAVEMRAALIRNTKLLREEVSRRRLTPLFAHDQTGEP